MSQLKQTFLEKEVKYSCIFDKDTLKYKLT